MVVKFIHVLLAISSIGMTSTFGITMSTIGRLPGGLRHALLAIQRLDRIAAFSFVGLLITGIVMGAMGVIRWKEFWYLGSIVLLTLAMAISGAILRPNLRAMLALTEKGEAPMNELEPMAMKARKGGAVTALIGLTIRKCSRARRSRSIHRTVSQPIGNALRTASSVVCKSDNGVACRSMRSIRHGGSIAAPILALLSFHPRRNAPIRSGTMVAADRA
jgi:hypothetical protein